MNHMLKKAMIICAFILLLIICVGCVGLTEGYKKFNIKGFEDFFSISSVQEKEEYLDSGLLDFSKKNDIFLVPFLKESSHEECVLLLTAYSKNAKNKISLDKVTISTKDDIEISCIEEFGELEVLSDWSETMTLIASFKKSEEWFYDENELIVNIDATISNEESSTKAHFIYNVSIVGYKGPEFQV